MTAIHKPILSDRLVIAWYGQYIIWYISVQFCLCEYKHRYIESFTNICKCFKATLGSYRVDVIVHY